MIEKNNIRIKTIEDFVTKVKRKHQAGISTEHSYRSSLENLLTIFGGSTIYPINEAKRIKYGAPDITLMHKDIAIGYLEAKKIGIDIRKFKDANKNQFERYTQNLDNLVYTDCLKWDFYRNGERIRSVSIAELVKGVITPKPTAYNKLIDYLQEFISQRPQTITTADELTEHTAKKTLIMRHAFEESLLAKNPVKSLEKQYNTVVKELIKGLDKEEFADMYAQTVTYGLFAAWFDNKTPDKFNRQEIEKLLPENYPFLKNLFEFITSKTLDKALEWAIDDLIAVYNAADLEKIKETYGQGSGRTDLFIHFYEDFLQKYDSKKRKEHGVYYTPEPIVDFIVRGVDWVLKNKFDIQEGLANTEKIIPPKQFDPLHKIQILDPATGTGTFLAQTISHIEKQVKPSAPDNWSSYVDKDLLPRLNGFEMLMAPYTMCYLKLDRVLKESDYIATNDRPERMHIYLTNSLTEANKDITELPYNDWLEKEAQGAADIKDNQPIMCVIGNPPYNAKSKNNDPWIERLIEDYKKEPGGVLHLKEHKHVLSDDYVKFIRMAQHMVDKNGEGVVGMITNHGYLDNPTFRGMRWHLMNSFDGIYVLDLHGDRIKNKTAPNGQNDKNVFNIQQGVSIIIAWKTKQVEGTDKPLAQVFRGDFRGAREKKFNALIAKGKALPKESLDKKIFKKIDPRAPDYFFKPTAYKLKSKYESGFKITDFMSKHSVGIITRKDKVTIDISEISLWNRVKDIATMPLNEIREKHGILADSATWKLSWAKKDVKQNYDKKLLTKIFYRPFDERWTYYTGKSTGFMSRPLKNIMNHFLEEPNLGLVAKRGFAQEQAAPIFCTNTISDFRYWSSSGMQGGDYVFPLHLYPNDTSKPKNVNMDETIRKAIEDIATDSKHGTPDEVQIFDYIYGVLHAPTYRKLYSEFIKEDFPRIPYPQTPAEFWYLSSIGTKLRNLHLMNTKKIKFDPKAYPFKGVSDNIIRTGTKILRWNNNKIFINKTQYFDSVPESAWDFHIGGYQPAQKWLKDRRNQTLDYENITHYQKIIAVLVQTKTTMDEIKWSRP